MHDIKAIRENPEAFDAALARRRAAPMSSTILAIDDARRSGRPTEARHLGREGGRDTTFRAHVAPVIDLVLNSVQFDFGLLQFGL